MLDELDMRRLDEYFRRLLGDDDVEDWRRTLLRRELLVEPTPAGEPCCSCAAYVLFAIEPRRRLPQAGLRLLVFPGTDMDYDAKSRRGAGPPLRRPWGAETGPVH